MRDRSALLHWKDPPFSGAPPVQYDLESMGTAKFDSKDWARIGAFTTIATNKFQAPHLVPGMAVRFRVRARNQGGWGEWSEPSDYIMPIAQPLVGVAADMTKAAHKGLPYVLRSMQKNSTISEAQKLGSWQLATVATKQRGFKRAGLAKDCATTVLEAMRTFALDSEMQAKGCLVLGWCFYKHHGVARDAQKSAADVIATAKANFPENVAVNSNASWAISNLYPPDSDDEDDSAKSPSKTKAADDGPPSPANSTG